MPSKLHRDSKGLLAWVESQEFARHLHNSGILKTFVYRRTILSKVSLPKKPRPPSQNYLLKPLPELGPGKMSFGKAAAPLTSLTAVWLKKGDTCQFG